MVKFEQILDKIAQYNFKSKKCVKKIQLISAEDQIVRERASGPFFCYLFWLFFQGQVKWIETMTITFYHRHACITYCTQ